MKKKIKQFISQILVTVLIVTSGLSGGAVSVQAGYDETSPVINSVVLSDNSVMEYKNGEKVNFVVDITEEETGVESCWFTVSNGEVGETIYVSITDAFAGKYYASLIIPNKFTKGDYYLIDCTCTDVMGNIGTFVRTGETLFKVVDTATDNVAPTIKSISFKDKSVNAGEEQKAVIECLDSDLKSIYFTYLKLDGNGKQYSVSINIDTVEESGIYEVPFVLEEAAVNGEYFINWIEAYDINGNKYATTPSPVYFNVINGVEPVTGTITIDKLNISETKIVLPGLTEVHIEGSVNGTEKDIKVMLSVACGGSQRYSFYNDVVKVVDGKFIVDGILSFDSDCKAEEDLTLMVSLSNDDVFYTEYVSQPIRLYKALEDIYAQVALNNPNIITTIKNMSDDDTLLIKSDRGASKVSAEIFEVIKGTNKTLVFDIDGIQWFFNGKDIKECKDIDISVMVQSIDATQYGYEEDTNAVALVFAPNGVLPGEAEIRIKSDYVANKFNVGDKLYLGFIKESADEEDEIIVSGNSVSDNSVSGNTIDIYEDELIKIEDIKVEYKGAYVSLYLTHNSSYILSDKKPVGLANIDKHTNTEVRNAVAATCKNEGYTGDTYCKECGKKVSNGKVIPKTEEHQWDAGVITQKSTRKEKGIKAYTCKVCGKSRTETLAALGAHNKGTIKKDDSGKGVYKVTKKGLTGGSVSFVKPVNNKKASYIIPATVKIEGIVYKVTSIEKNAFKNNKKLTKITIGSNVKKIGGNAFYGCKKLKNVLVKTKKLTSVGKNAFKGIKANAKIIVPSSKLKKYKKLLKNKGQGKKVKISKA